LSLDVLISFLCCRRNSLSGSNFLLAAIFSMCSTLDTFYFEFVRLLVPASLS
jgi:hypothetical protein